MNGAEHALRLACRRFSRLALKAASLEDGPADKRAKAVRLAWEAASGEYRAREAYVAAGGTHAMAVAITKSEQEWIYGDHS